MRDSFSQIKNEFPIFAAQSGKLVYLDSGATSQKPRCVIDAVIDCYETKNANIHRGVYSLSQRATEAFDSSREVVRRFLNAKNASEIVFVRGATEGINLIATAFGRSEVKEGDEIILSYMEHHSNIVPWKMLCEEVGAKLKVIELNSSGELDLDNFKSLISKKTKLVSLAHVSNVLGTINPIKEIVAIAHGENIPVLVDGAQAVAHIPVDLQELDCDFYVFSAHKTYGPSGIGVLYAKEEFLNKMSPYQGGGDMIESVSFDKITYARPPQRFEAGTVHLAGALGLAAALKFVEDLGIEKIAEHEKALAQAAELALSEIPGLKIVGQAKDKTGVVSFILAGVHPHDVATILDQEGLALRAGHHCAQPLMQYLGISATTRATFGVYNTAQDVEALVAGVKQVRKFFK